LRARSLIGQAFTKKGWYREAAETFERALETELTEETSKEIRYFLGDVLQTMNELARAQEQFSMVAQVDYNYKDVRQRIEQIRQKLQGGGEDKSEAAPT
jgi:tetratricopeptide (TPR) repeat protein